MQGPKMREKFAGLDSNSNVVRYGIALGSVIVAVVLQLGLSRVTGNRFPFATLFFAVLVSAWRGGTGPAFFAVAWGGVLAALLLVVPRPDLAVLGSDLQFGMLLFAGVGSGIALLGGRMRAVQERARRKAGELYNEREHLRVTLQSIGDGVIVTDAEGRVRVLNRIAELLTGWTSAAASGKPLEEIFKIVNESTRETVENPVTKALRMGTVVGLANHTVLISRTGDERPIDDSAAPIRLKDGSISGVILVFRDISERKHAEKSLEEQQRRFEITLRSIGDAVVSADANNRVTFLNRAAESLTGWQASEAIGQPLDAVYQVLHSPMKQTVDFTRNETLPQGSTRSSSRVPATQATLTHRTGAVRPVAETRAPIHDDAGQIRGLVITARDVSDQRRGDRRRTARLAATQSLSQGSAITEAMPAVLRALCESLDWDVGALWLVNPLEEVIFCSNEWCKDESAAPAFLEATRTLKLGKGPGLPGRTWASGLPCWVPDVARDADFSRREAAIEGNLHGAFAFPILAGNRVIGVMEFFSREIREPDEDLLDMMSTIGAQLGQFLERRRAEVATAASEERLRLALDASRMGIWDWNILTNTITWSDNLEEMHGLTPGEFDGTFAGFEKLIHPEDRNLVQRSLQEAIHNRTVYAIEFRTLLQDGSVRWTSGRGKAFYNDQGEAVRMLGVCLDITERKHEEQHRRLQAQVLESMSEGVSLATEDGTIVYTNPAEDRIFRYERGELIGRHVSELNAGTDEERLQVTQRVIEQLNQHGRWEGEFSNRRKDGTLFTTFVRITPLEMQGSSGRYWVCVQEDVTDQKRAEENLRQSEEQFRRAIVDAPIPIIMHAEDGEVLTLSKTWCRLTGFSPDEVRRFDDWLNQSFGSEADSVRSRVRSLFDADAGLLEGEYPITTKGGERRIWNITASAPGRLRDGRRFLVGMANDVTDRRRSEQAARFLADVSANLAGLVDHQSTLQRVARLAIPHFADWCSVHLVDESGQITQLAAAHVNLEKQALADEISLRFPYRADGPHGPSAVVRTGRPEILSHVTDGTLASLAQNEEHLRMLRSMGLSSLMCVPLNVWRRTLGVLVFALTESGRHYGPEELAVAEDLCHRAAIAIENSRLYAELRDADRRKDEFLAMLAHELRNPLAPLRTGLELLAVDVKAPQTDTIDVMREQVAHIVRMVDDLLDVSRIMRGKIELKKEAVDLGESLARAVDIVRPFVTAQRHELIVHKPEQPVWLEADPVRLTQVLTNLLNNAAKYTDPGGRIEVTVSPEPLGVKVIVRDTGVGIEPDLLPRVFDLFTQGDRSIDRAQGGLGIGLTLVKSLVEMHGGSVSVDSEGPGHGSEFTVRLPTLSERRSVQPDRWKPAPTRKWRVLVVDDNVGSARILARMLAQFWGHEVHTAFDGVSALRETKAFNPELILLDIGLPGLDGYEVARRLREDPQTAKVVLVALTGYGQEEDRRRSHEAGFNEHLVKPASVEALQAVFLRAEKLDYRETP